MRQPAFRGLRARCMHARPLWGVPCCTLRPLLQAQAGRVAEALACPCVSDLKRSTCGDKFVQAFSCFHLSTSQPHGCDCLQANLAFAVRTGVQAPQTGSLTGTRAVPPVHWRCRPGPLPPAVADAPSCAQAVDLVAGMHLLTEPAAPPRRPACATTQTSSAGAAPAGSLPVAAAPAGALPDSQAAPLAARRWAACTLRIQTTGRLQGAPTSLVCGAQHCAGRRSSAARLPGPDRSGALRRGGWAPVGSSDVLSGGAACAAAMRTCSLSGNMGPPPMIPFQSFIFI